MSTPNEIVVKPSLSDQTINAAASIRTMTGGAGGAVTSVNGQTGTVVLDAEDVGALPDSTVVPSKTSDLTNDSGFVDASGAASAAPVQSVNGQTGAVTITVPAAASSGTPAMDGTASRGSSTQYARADHVHPTDTSRAAASDLAAKADKVSEVTVSTAGAVTQALDAGKIYHFTGALTALTITLNAPASGDPAQYHFDFDSGSTAATLTMPNTITMPDSFTVEANKRYEVDVLNNYGAVVSWANS